MKVPSFIQSLLLKLVGAFNLALHAALDAVHNLKISDALQQAAHDAVLAAEQTGGDGSAKFITAVAAVQKDFTGIAIGIIHTAVQNAWGSLYGSTAAVPAAS